SLPRGGRLRREGDESSRRAGGSPGGFGRGASERADERDHARERSRSTFGLERPRRGRRRDRVRDTRGRDPDRAAKRMTRTVLKFGGTSVASPAALQRVAEIVENTRGHRIVEVSATARRAQSPLGPE